MFCFNLSPVDSRLLRLCFAIQQVSDQTNCGNFKCKIVIQQGLYTEELKSNRRTGSVSNKVQIQLQVQVRQILFFRI